MSLDEKLFHRVELSVPGLPGDLEGLRVAHLSDLHIRRWRGRYRWVVSALKGAEFDLAFLTGDYIDWPGDEEAGLSVMEEVCGSLRARLGVYGVYGNHDTPEIRESFKRLPVHWLEDGCVRLGGVSMEIIGFDSGRFRQPDAVAAALALGEMLEQDEAGGREAKRLRVLLSHFSMWLPTASDMGVDLMFSGHTHGGQFRLPWKRALYNSSDWPKELTAGVLRHRDTLCLVTRGLGETGPPIRLFCPPHIPVYTLRRGSMPGEKTDGVINVVPW